MFGLQARLRCIVSPRFFHGYETEQILSVLLLNNGKHSFEVVSHFRLLLVVNERGTHLSLV